MSRVPAEMVCSIGFHTWAESWSISVMGGIRDAQLAPEPAKRTGDLEAGHVAADHDDARIRTRRLLLNPHFFSHLASCYIGRDGTMSGGQAASMLLSRTADR